MNKIDCLEIICHIITTKQSGLFWGETDLNSLISILADLPVCWRGHFIWMVYKIQCKYFRVHSAENRWNNFGHMQPYFLSVWIYDRIPHHCLSCFQFKIKILGLKNKLSENLTPWKFCGFTWCSSKVSLKTDENKHYLEYCYVPLGQHL